VAAVASSLGEKAVKGAEGVFMDGLVTETVGVAPKLFPEVYPRGRRLGTGWGPLDGVNPMDIKIAAVKGVSL